MAEEIKRAGNAVQEHLVNIYNEAVGEIESD